jgi:hypothetical protein
LTRKHPPRFLITPAAGELGMDDRVTDRGVSNPVLHKAEICAGVEEVSSYRVFEHMEMPLERSRFELSYAAHLNRGVGLYFDLRA